MNAIADHERVHRPREERTPRPRRRHALLSRWLAGVLLAAGPLFVAIPAPEALAAPEPTRVRLVVDLYDRPGGGGRVIDSLAPTQGGAPPYIADCRPDHWCQLFMANEILTPGSVARWAPGESLGWVYSGPDYNSLGIWHHTTTDQDAGFQSAVLSQATNLYNSASGRQTGSLPAQMPVRYRCRADNWCEVTQLAPVSIGGNLTYPALGWIYSGPDHNPLGRTQ